MGEIDTKINRRVQKSKQIYCQINQTIGGKNEIDNNTKTRIYKTFYLPVLLCGSESWTVLIKHANTITGPETRYFRNCTEKTRTDKIRNSQIRGTQNKEPVSKMVDRRTLRCSGQLIRLDKNRKPRQVWEAIVER
jgi:hypothetical protein